MALVEIRSRRPGDRLAAGRFSRSPDEPPRDVEIFESSVAPRLVARWDPPDDDPAPGPDLTAASSLLVTLRGGIAPSAAESVLRRVVLPERPEDERLRVRPLLPASLHLVEWEDDPDVIEGEVAPGFLLARATRIAAEPEVDAVDPNDFLSKIPLKPILQLLSSLPNPQDELKQMRVPEVWERKTSGSRRVRVALLDSGVDPGHESLRENLYQPDGHVVGWAFGSDPPDFTDDNGHGTFCAGLIGSRDGHGVNKRVSIIPIKFLNAHGDGTVGHAIEGIHFALQQGARVISCSWGSTTDNPRLRGAIEEAHKAGSLVVAGAGNSRRNLDTHPFYPAAYPLPNVISVGSCDDHDRPAPFWGYGEKRVHLTAPGATVYSTAFGNGNGQQGGTSASTAFVAGACALLMAAEPELSHIQVKDRLIRSVARLQGQRAAVTSSCCSQGRLDVANAILHKKLDTKLNCP